MPSITFWNRLEPRSRASDITEALAARVRDPAWLLARQWQLGEFAGEDAASPAYIKVAGTTSKVCGWGTTGGTVNTFDADNPPPLESVALREPFSENDLPTQVELGQWFERLLGGQGAEAAVSPVHRYLVTILPINKPQGSTP